MEECDQNILNVFDQFGILYYFQQTDIHRCTHTHVTKGSIKGRKNSESLDFQVVFVKQNQSCAIKKFEMFLIKLTSLHLAQLYIFWKKVHGFQ